MFLPFYFVVSFLLLTFAPSGHEKAKKKQKIAVKRNNNGTERQTKRA
jgi:hypothetical protein